MRSATSWSCRLVILLGGMRCRCRRICSYRRTRRGADATTVLTVLLRAVVLVAVFLARTLFTLIQYHWSRSASATTTKRQHRLDGDAGLARPVRSRGGFPASLAFFSLIALALGPMWTWSSPPSAALSRGRRSARVRTGENSSNKSLVLTPGDIFFASCDLAPTHPTQRASLGTLDRRKRN